MKKKEKLSFKDKKNNVINSIKEVECFLRKSGKFADYLKICKIIKNNKN